MMLAGLQNTIYQKTKDKHMRQTCSNYALRS